MEDVARPTIKGLFVRSHVRALELERGQAGVDELQRLLGHSVHYRTTDDVPVADEVRMLEHIVDITSPVLLSDHDRELEAGRLHFRNFSTTALWTLVLQIFGKNFKFLVMQSALIARWVFRGIAFESVDLGPTLVKIIMHTGAYGLAHFEGFFQQWLSTAHIHGTVEAVSTAENRCEYTISWT